MGLMSELEIRVRNGGDDAVAAAREMVDATQAENDRLWSLTRFQDRVIRSGSVATLTEQEREAIQLAIACTPTEWAAPALRGLLERMT